MCFPSRLTARSKMVSPCASHVTEDLPASAAKILTQPLCAAEPSAAINEAPSGVNRRAEIRSSRLDEAAQVSFKPDASHNLISRKLPLASDWPSGLHTSERTASRWASTSAITGKFVAVTP